jgi:hypothetical protein
VNGKGFLQFTPVSFGKNHNEAVYEWVNIGKKVSKNW